MQKIQRDLEIQLEGEKALNRLEDAAGIDPPVLTTKQKWAEAIKAADGVVFYTTDLSTEDCTEALIECGYQDLTDRIWVKPFVDWFEDDAIEAYNKGIETLCRSMDGLRNENNPAYLNIANLLRAIALMEKDVS